MKYKQKPNIKISKEFKTKLMKMKLDLDCKDLEEVIKRMYEIIVKFKLASELKKEELKNETKRTRIRIS